MEEEKEKLYRLTTEEKTIKQFFDRFYCIPKDLEVNKELKTFLENNSLVPIDDDVRNGKNGYIVFRKNKKKLTQEEVQKIKNDTGSYRSKADKYNISVGTISKIMNDKY